MKIKTDEKLDYKYIETPILIIDEIKEKYELLASKEKNYQIKEFITLLYAHILLLLHI